MGEKANLDPATVTGAGGASVVERAGDLGREGVGKVADATAGEVAKAAVAGASAAVIAKGGAEEDDADTSDGATDA